MSQAIATFSVQDALAWLKQRGIESARVNTVREMADFHRNHSSSTIQFQAKEHAGWQTECFVPTWFCFDGQIAHDRQGAIRIGSSAEAVLQELQYSPAQIAELRATQVVLGTEWTP